MIQVGDSYMTALEVRGFPPHLDLAWLSDLDESEQTRVLLENAKTKLILGLNRDSDAVARAAALLGLNEQEAAYLASCRMVKGIGSTALLLADGERTPLMIPMWPETIHQIITGRSRTAEARP